MTKIEKYNKKVQEAFEILIEAGQVLDEDGIYVDISPFVFVVKDGFLASGSLNELDPLFKTIEKKRKSIFGEKYRKAKREHDDKEELFNEVSKGMDKIIKKIEEKLGE